MRCQMNYGCIMRMAAPPSYVGFKAVGAAHQNNRELIERFLMKCKLHGVREGHSGLSVMICTLTVSLRTSRTHNHPAVTHCKPLITNESNLLI